MTEQSYDALQRRHDDFMRDTERLHLELIALRVECEAFLAELTDQEATR